MSAPSERDLFRRLARDARIVPLVRRLMSDQLTPVLAYRRLVTADDRTAPSFLLESVEGGAAVGRFSFIGAQPALEVTAYGREVTIRDHRRGSVRTEGRDDPLEVLRELSGTAVATRDEDPWRSGAFAGGWVGYAGYDAVRYLEPEKLSFADAPRDDRGLPDLHFGLYGEVGVFDHARKMLFAIHHVFLDDHASVDHAFDAGQEALDDFVRRLETGAPPLPGGRVELDLDRRPGRDRSTMTQAQFEAAVTRAKAYIAAGDVFQVVLSQRFERETPRDPFDVYRALRIVNPSPYMIYLQAHDVILVASSPEILCRCHGRTVVSRPLAGTRPRGRTEAEDRALAKELLADEKERAEHVMLVDLGRNDVGRVSDLASVCVERMLEVERYSHVMHLSSTVTGTLRAGLDGWDALRSTLPVGTVSGAPKVRAMQIIDELEPTRRGPYAGGIGYAGFGGDMDMAIALRTIVFPTAQRPDGGAWRAHLQAGAGIVTDSVPAREYEETVNKAAALGRAIDLAEAAFSREDE